MNTLTMRRQMTPLVALQQILQQERDVLAEQIVDDGLRRLRLLLMTFLYAATIAIFHWRRNSGHLIEWMIATAGRTGHFMHDCAVREDDAVMSAGRIGRYIVG